VIGSISIGFVIFMLIFGLFLTAMPVHLESEFGLSAGQRGLVIAIPALTSTVTALRLGWLRQRFGVVGLLTWAGVLFTISFVVIGQAAVLPVLFAAALLYGLGEGVFIPTLQDVVAGAAAPEQRGAVVAVWVGAARAGQTAGPLLAAGLYGATSTSTTFLVGGAIAAGLVVFELVGRFGGREHGPSPTHGARALVASPD
jgi:MFS family permease